MKIDICRLKIDTFKIPDQGKAIKLPVLFLIFFLLKIFKSVGIWFVTIFK